MNNTPEQKPASTELTGGAGFTFEDTVVAYYLAHLLRHERAAGQSGIVSSVAVQQRGQGNPMDDLVVGFDDAGRARSLGLQIKRSITISGADSNEDFRDIIKAASKTQAVATFAKGADLCGFIVENVTPDTLRTLKRLIDWAKDSPTSAEFVARFMPSGTAAAAETKLRNNLRTVIGATNDDKELAFYQHFTAMQISGLEENGALRTDVVNRLSELVADNKDGIDLLLFDRLCRIARDGAATGKRWTRPILLEQLRGAVRLKVIPFFASDVDRLNAYSRDSLDVVQEDVDGFHVDRADLQTDIAKKLAKHRVVSIGGLPGCGKSAVLKRFAQTAATVGPILFIKNDRIDASNWIAFATRLGLSHADPVPLLQEIGSAGTPILFIDGIDRIRPGHQEVIKDLVNKIVTEPSLAHWKVLVSSRDQGLEAFRAWFPTALYKETGIGDVMVGPFADEEADQLAESKPNLRSLLFGSDAVRNIARRPFFAAVLARSIPSGAVPQTEVELIDAWWARAGHDAHADTIPQRRRALIDIAKNGVGNLGKCIPAKDLDDATHAQIAALTADHIIREEQGGSLYAFSHDIFFEWAFLRYLIDLGDDWMTTLEEAGEPPLLGRVVGLMAQQAIKTKDRWTEGYRALEKKNLRRQWQREWLTAPPFTSAFSGAKEEFSELLKADNFALLEKVLVWFQAQHTIPSPVYLGQIRNPVEGIDNIAIADMLGWPSDFRAWGRLIDWILAEEKNVPVRLIPKILEVFEVWQNALSANTNARSKAMLTLAETWLLRFEEGKLRDANDDSIYPFGREEGTRVGSALRMILLRSAHSYPDFAKAIFQRAVADKDRRRKVYNDLMNFAPIMSQVAPDLLADLAETQLMEELPLDEYNRKRKEREDYYKRLNDVRAIPEDERTPNQQRMVDQVHFPIGVDRLDEDDVGIEQHNSFYHPPSALHEPYKSLLANSPAVALRLIRNLSNHATEGWKQLHVMRKRELGTPIPVVIEFPWSTQEFWGDWRVYSWGQGQLAPTALECAFLALTYWAFRQVDGGRPTSDVIKDFVEGNTCLAVLGIALDLTLESWATTDTTLPLAACQRIWAFDRARYSQESSKNIDLLGYGFLSRLYGEKAEAKTYLDERKYRKRTVTQLAMFFALNEDDALRKKFKEALAQFPNDLPYENEEDKTNQSCINHLKEDADGWAGLGDQANYKQSAYGEDRVAITYDRPNPLTPAQEKRLEKSTKVLQGFNVAGWAGQSLNNNKLEDGMTLDAAVAHVKGLDTGAAFDFRDGMTSDLPSVAASVAACVISFSPLESADRAWAWGVLARIETMLENPEKFGGSIVPWHPKRRLAVALFHDRRTDKPRADSVERLMKLTLHPLNVVSELAFEALFADKDEHIRWVAGQLAISLCTVHSGEFKGSAWDHSKNDQARANSLARALAALKTTTPGPMPKLPPAWAKGGSHRGRELPDNYWHMPDPFFDSQMAAKLFKNMPLEVWMASGTYRPLMEGLLFELTDWTKESLLPSWRDEKKRKTSDDRRSDLHEWTAAFGDILARCVPHVTLDVARKRLIAPLLAENEEALSVLASFADRLVCRHVFDAAIIPANAIPLLDDCATRLINDSMFKPDGWRPGHVHGFPMPELIKALLFVAPDQNCPGSARFANGDWAEIETIMPIIDRVARNIGWSQFVMDRYIVLHKRAGQSFPVAAFASQLNAALSGIGNSDEGWTGTDLPAQLAAIVQRQADWNFELKSDDAQALLKILDALIDLGDRRSAALEQTEAFRSVKGSGLKST